jgi:hypothetical protein
MKSLKPILKKIGYLGRRSTIQVANAVEWLVGWYDPLNSDRIRQLDVQACLDLEHEKACDRVIETSGV